MASAPTQSLPRYMLGLQGGNLRDSGGAGEGEHGWEPGRLGSAPALEQERERERERGGWQTQEALGSPSPILCPQVLETTEATNGAGPDPLAKDKEQSPTPSPKPRPKGPILIADPAHAATLPPRAPEPPAQESMEGALCRKQEMEAQGKKAANR